MKLFRPICLFVILAVSIFYPISFSNVFVYSQEVETEEIVEYEEWTADRSVSNPVHIMPGATLVIKNGITITFDNGGIDIEGNMIVSGTLKEPVIFQKAEASQNYSIAVEGGAKLLMRNVDMSGSGLDVYITGNKPIINRAMASYIGGIQVNGGWLDAQGCNFHDNDVAISIINQDAEKIRVNRSKFSNNNLADVFFQNRFGTQADFKYNWWGNSSGPPKTCSASGICYFDKMEGRIDYSDWLTTENFIDPVIIIPGIMGSFDVFGEKKIDPIFGSYNGLLEVFGENDYISGQNLFTFPYEWRDSNVENAKLLGDKIGEIKLLNNWPKVDIVAHSMGGLLAREYIESEYYLNDIDQLITLGTPHNGAPKDYLVWEGGKLAKSKIDIFGMFIEDFFRWEATEKGFSDIFDYVRNRPMESVRELLPTYDYLFDTENGQLRGYPNNYPINDFLVNLNSSARILNMKNVEFNNIVGNLDDPSSTISKINVVSISDETLWEHGYPKNFDDIFGEHGLEYGSGDGTVPIFSASNIVADETIPSNFKHSDLPAKEVDRVYELLNNKPPEKKSVFEKISDIVAFFVFSPIDIQVVETNTGRRVGKDFDHPGQIFNEIGGAYYTGYETASEFLTIPNPEDGEYKIFTQGTEDGEYKVEVTKISEDPVNPDNAIESTVILEGSATTGQLEEKSALVSGDEIIIEMGDAIPPTITGWVTTSPNANGWYNGDVIVHFDATDADSGVVSVTPDIIISTEGAGQSASGTAIDNAGNTASTTVSGINIDKTRPDINIASPEDKNYLNDQILNFSYTASDAISGIVSEEALFDSQPVGESADLSLLGLGEHNFIVTATDRAGNQNQQEVALKTSASIYSIINNTNHYHTLGFIKTDREKQFLLKNLKITASAIGLINVLSKTSAISPAWREYLKNQLIRAVNRQIDFLVAYINKNASIINPAKNLLAESLRSIKFLQ
ncbi:MAG: hypothetical protein CO141_00460 [Candidatus Moranbacteria bacterium CG_4_9_14_3_um_filter_42_9]|nr:MAG: hypothetical protein CO141_00460 [Candidatus Moranbacteria bacterium CG_4_9_14_3_um_filter_42_9]